MKLTTLGCVLAILGAALFDAGIQMTGTVTAVIGAFVVIFAMETQ